MYRANVLTNSAKQKVFLLKRKRKWNEREAWLQLSVVSSPPSRFPATATVTEHKIHVPRRKWVCLICYDLHFPSATWIYSYNGESNFVRYTKIIVSDCSVLQVRTFVFDSLQMLWSLVQLLNYNINFVVQFFLWTAIGKLLLVAKKSELCCTCDAIYVFPILSSYISPGSERGPPLSDRKSAEKVLDSTSNYNI